MPDYVGAIGSYGVLLFVAESDTFGSVAVALAWAIAAGLVLELITNFGKLNPKGG
jgi:hypothetical protein